MKRQEFINGLRKALANLPAGEREEILRDQEESLHDAELAGRNEEEFIATLGNPGKRANFLNVDTKIKTAARSHSLRVRMGRVFSAALAILALAPINLIFVLWPFMMVSLLTLLLWILAGGLTLFAIAAFFIFCFKLIFIQVGFWTHFSAASFIIGWISAGLLSLWVMFQITRAEVNLSLYYLKWNLRWLSGGLFK